MDCTGQFLYQSKVETSHAAVCQGTTKTPYRGITKTPWYLGAVWDTKVVLSQFGNLSVTLVLRNHPMALRYCPPKGLWIVSQLCGIPRLSDLAPWPVPVLARPRRRRLQ